MVCEAGVGLDVGSVRTAIYVVSGMYSRLDSWTEATKDTGCMYVPHNSGTRGLSLICYLEILRTNSMGAVSVSC